jgi:hypothetical protein
VFCKAAAKQLYATHFPGPVGKSEAVENRLSKKRKDIAGREKIARRKQVSLATV